VQLVIFGAGDDVLPLVRVAHEIGWHTTVVDTRMLRGSRDRFSLADRVVQCRPEDIGELVRLTSQTSVVVMTHNYLHDLELLRTLLLTKFAYLGLLGPKRRAERLLLDIEDGDELATAALLHRMHAPAGLDIGAETACEIAVSVVAEIKAVLTNREGGLLRRRIGSIHSNASVWDTDRSLREQKAAVV
jgi:xanthine dehydrogenase accessory factor